MTTPNDLHRKYSDFVRGWNTFWRRVDLDENIAVTRGVTLIHTACLAVIISASGLFFLEEALIIFSVDLILEQMEPLGIFLEKSIT